MKKLLLLLTFLLIQTVKAQINYFPPLTGSTWDQANFNAFPYDSSYTDSLYNFLETKGCKAFLVLYDGKIVKEKYFGTFEADSFWYWASAGKTLAGFLVGQAQDQDCTNPASRTKAMRVPCGITTMRPICLPMPWWKALREKLSRTLKPSH